jgi:DNA-directed RNA polymerase specialized sigma24 family protein
MESADAPLTDLLQCSARGEAGALDQVFAVLYRELRQIAHARLRSQGGVAHLETTALVHESFLHPVARNGLALTDRKHFFTYAAMTMHNIIIDFAREQLAEGAPFCFERRGCRWAGLHRHGPGARKATTTTDSTGHTSFPGLANRSYTSRTSPPQLGFW